MITRFSLSRWHSRSSAWLGSIMPEEITPSLKDEFKVCHDSDGLLTMLHSQSTMIEKHKWLNVDATILQFAGWRRRPKP